MADEVGIGAPVSIRGLVNRTDLNSVIGLVVRPDPGDGRLGIAIGVETVRVKLANLRIAPPNATPTPLRTVHTLPDAFQLSSPINLDRFRRWVHDLQNVDDARWFIGQVVVVMHATDPVVGFVPTPGVALADGTSTTMRRATCAEPCCARCAQRRGGYRFSAVGPWTWNADEPPALYCQQEVENMMRLQHWPRL